ncbi:filaggrin-like [Amphibalanus amphitrite]|uniref:filaggrin-like n=1 Tax=Amphibalanus amphitrite TaxID=1232801 RepID=UPI001C918BD4|nr:filaggrin-like [Amphibalanus amphitrite]
MGNHHSQTVELNPAWSHSFPREREKKLLKYGGIQDATPVRKVLPERVPGQKLRLTTNGNILQQGGTISGRRLSAAHSFNPLTDGQQPQSLQPGLGNGSAEDTQKGYDSEPDLRDAPEEQAAAQHPDPTDERQARTLTRDGPAKARARSRKKSRAPPPPPVSDLDLPPPPSMPPPPIPSHTLDRGRDGDRDSNRPRTGLFTKHGETRRHTGRYSPRANRAASEQRWLNGEPQMQERKSRAQSMACIRQQAAADLVTSFSSLPRAEKGERRERGEQTSPGSLLRRSGEARHSRSEGALQAALADGGGNEGGRTGGTLHQAISTEDHRITITVGSSSESSNSAHRHAKQPNVFYFGMEPPSEKRDDDDNKPSAIAKIKRNEQVAIRGSAVSYTKRTVGEGRHKSPSNAQKTKSPTSSRSGEVAKSPASSRSREPVKSPSSGRSGANTKSPGSRRSDNVTDPQATGSPASLARIPSRKLAEFVNSLERSRQKRLSVSRDEILTNSSALSCKSQSSVFDLELDAGGNDSISMHLRPTLPRKQLEIPRFSPLSAWRSLTLDRAASRPWRTADTSDASDGPEPLTTPPRRRRPHTKSADSGISGDASSPPPPPLAASSPTPDRADEWVPAHDLDLSSGGEEPAIRHQHGTVLPPQLMSRTDMFPASAEPPSERGDRQTSPHTFNSLRQMKRSVSTAIAALRRSPAHSIDENWLLSRSVPNSLNAGEEEVARPNEARSDGGAGGGDRHVLYLPEYHSMPLPRRADRAVRMGRRPAGKRDTNRSAVDLWSTGDGSQNQTQDRGESLDCSRDDSQDQRTNTSRDESRDSQRDEPEPEQRQRRRHGSRDELRGEERRATPEKPPRTSLSTAAGKRRFSYQSTVRQQERRRLEARLSRLAEEEEQQRLKELRLLHQVEEQFQKKRGKEQTDREGPMSIQGPISLPVPAPGERVIHDSTGDRNQWRDGPEKGHQDPPQHGPISLQIPPCPPPDYGPAPTVCQSHDGPISLPVTSAHRSGKSRDKQTFLSGVRNWIRSRKESPRGTDGAWQTAARLEPEGAPAVVQQDGVRPEGPQSLPQTVGARTELSRQEEVRQEALSAARQRSGRPTDKRKSIYKQVAEFAEDVSDVSGVNSPVSELSPDPLQTSSGYESSPPLPPAQRLTRELPEYRHEARHYSDYRPAPAAKQHRSPPFAEVFGPTRSGRRTPAAIYSEAHNRAASSDRNSGTVPSDPYAEHQPLRAAPMTSNYRRAFAQGTAASPPQSLDMQYLQHGEEGERDATSPPGGQRRKQRTKTSRRNDSFKRSLGQLEAESGEERRTGDSGHGGPRSLHLQHAHPVYGQQRTGYVGQVNSSPARFMYGSDPFAAQVGYRPGHHRPAPPATRLV